MGGAEMLMTTLLPELKQQGLDVELICINAVSNESYLNELFKNKIPVHILAPKGNPYNPFNIIRLYKLFKRLKPNVLHAHLFPSFYWLALTKILRLNKIPILMTEHDTSNRRLRSPYWKFIERIIYKQYNAIICISDGVKETMDSYMPMVKSWIVYNGIPLEKYQQKIFKCKDVQLTELVDSIRKRPNAKIILSVGRLVIKKDHDTMIKTMAALPESTFLFIAGEGEMRSEIQNQIRTLNLDNRCFLLGNQSEIPYLISNADAGILTSTIEGFGLAAVEMMAGGLPVVASNVPGLREVSADKLLLANPKQEKEFAEILQKLFTDDAFYQSMKLKCIEKSTRFSIYSMAKQYAEIYSTFPTIYK